MRIKIPPDYAQRIKELRKKQNLTQEKLADLLGVSFASVNRWEGGLIKPNALAWQKIEKAAFLGFDSFDPAPTSHQVKEPRSDYHLSSAHSYSLDFSSTSEVVRTLVEGYRLSFGYQFNPAFATETSLIDPLPHQRIAVYEHMLTQPRLRFLIADDAGAGKTIMSGLYIREMLARKLIRRVLIVPPAGLVGNWEREMRTLFNLHFQIISGPDAKNDNPFLDSASDLSIISIDTLASERVFKRLQEPLVTPYDLVIFDEAHKLSADREPDFRERKTDRYKLGEAFSGTRVDQDRWRLNWSARHLILLTATPHMGKDYPYYCLWRLLEPEALSTFDAFTSYPVSARQKHFIRRSKEEMVRYDGSPIYPTRISDTLSYELTQGLVSEQEVYNQTTAYIEYYYNRAKMLNRSAARLTMSVFQRRLASSMWALICSLNRRIEKIETLIEDIRSGKINPDQLMANQKILDKKVKDVFDDSTADEEIGIDGKEENELSEEETLQGVIATNLGELEAECNQVKKIRDLAQAVYESGQGSKFDKLVEVLRDADYKDEKMIIFTEHRDTLTYLVRQLEGMGFTGQIVKIHGGMDYQQRQEAVDSFRKPISEGGAKYLVATDAAGEGINLQVCWLMVNYDIPWNPARLEQRMGRIHRYGQQHNPVFILNLIAGKTREGRVMKTLLEKLERIRKELNSDKVFDVVGRLFEGVSLRSYLEKALTDDGADEAIKTINGSLTAEQVQAVEDRERRLFGDGGDIKPNLPRLQKDLEREAFRRLLPGYVRNFFEHAAKLENIGFEGDVDSVFKLRPNAPGALDRLWPVVENHHPETGNRFTFIRPKAEDPAIYLHPGESFFDGFVELLSTDYGESALRGGVFTDPTISQPYLFHLMEVCILRKALPGSHTFSREEVLESHLMAIREDADGSLHSCPVETLLILPDAKGLPSSALSLASSAEIKMEETKKQILDKFVSPIVSKRKNQILIELPERESFLKKGFSFQEAELIAARSSYRDKANSGDSRAKAELTRIKEKQSKLAEQREEALNDLHLEPELIIPGGIQFLTHAIIVPSSDPVDIKARDDRVEQIAMNIAITYEEEQSAVVKDVHTPELARAAGLGDFPGFDILSIRSSGEERAIEVKGKAEAGTIQISGNEWSAACNQRGKYWIYSVFNCASALPRLLRVQDPWQKLISSVTGLSITENEILTNAES